MAMKRTISRILPLVLAVLLSGCAGTPAAPASQTDVPVSAVPTEPQTATVFAMDTVMDLTIYGDASLLGEAERTIASLEAAFSVTDPESEIAAVNRNGTAALGDDTLRLLTRALALCERTGGTLDVTVYPVVRAWGFTTGDYRVPDPDELAALLEEVDYTAVRIDGDRVTVGEGMQLDLGSVAKGYTGDRVTDLFRNAGVTSAILNLGGNVQTLGAKPDGKPWRVAVNDPLGNGYAGVVEVTDKAVITSGGYERYFVEDGTVYRHIIDPADGYPVDNGLLSVTIIGDEGVLCDAFSTALFVMGADRAAEFWRTSDDFEAILLTEDGEILVTEGIAADFEPLGDWSAAPLTVLHR